MATPPGTHTHMQCLWWHCNSKLISNWPVGMRVIYRTQEHTYAHKITEHSFSCGKKSLEHFSSGQTHSCMQHVPEGYVGYPSHSMTGWHDPVMSICLTCHVYTSSSHTHSGTKQPSLKTANISSYMVFFFRCPCEVTQITLYMIINNCVQ